MASKEAEDVASGDQLYEQVFEHLGKNWRWLRKISWLFLPSIFPGVLVMSYSFTGAIPDYRWNLTRWSLDNQITAKLCLRCFVDGCDKFTPETIVELNYTYEASENMFMKCMPNASTNNLFRCEANRRTQNLTEKCDRWVFDSSVFFSTVATEVSESCTWTKKSKICFYFTSSSSV